MAFSGLLQIYLLALLFSKYFVIDCSSHKKLQGDTTDSEVLKFTLHYYVSKLAKKPNALCRKSSVLSIEKRRKFMKAFIESQPNYCPLIDASFKMKCFWEANSTNNCIHKWSLRTVYADYKSFFNELLDEVSIYIPKIAIYIYEYIYDISNNIVWSFQVNKTILCSLIISNELYAINQ